MSSTDGGIWDFWPLIIFSTVVDYLVGQKLKNEENQSKRKVLLWISIAVNLGFLGFLNTTTSSWKLVNAFSLLGMQINANSLNIILPVGISFYTFQTLSYTIDVYVKKLDPTDDFIAFSAFVCFFPQLVAGPIERATNLLPNSTIIEFLNIKRQLMVCVKYFGVCSKRLWLLITVQYMQTWFSIIQLTTLEAPWFLAPYSLHFRYMVTSQVIQTSQLEHQDSCFDLNKTLLPLIFQEILLSFGDVGTFLWVLGLETTFTYLLVVAELVLGWE